MSKFRKGDIVTVEATIDRDVFSSGERPCIKIIIAPYHDVYVDPATLTMKRPIFEIGDVVTWKVDGLVYRGHVLSIHGNHVWVDRGDGEFATVWVDKLTRVEPEPDTVADVEEAPPAAPEAEAAE